VPTRQPTPVHEPGYSTARGPHTTGPLQRELRHPRAPNSSHLPLRSGSPATCAIFADKRERTPPRPRAPNLEFGITTTERENHEPPKAPHRCRAYTARIGALCALGSVCSSLKIVLEVVAGRECDLGTVNLTLGPQIWSASLAGNGAA
jgi:hypothetical protein